MTTRTRLVLVVPLYLSALWGTLFAGLSGSDAAGIICFLLAGAGLLQVVQVTLLRGKLTPPSVCVFNLVSSTALGLACGIAARGEEGTGAAAGLLIGGLSCPLSLWLGDLAQLRRKPRFFINYRQSDSLSECHEIYDALSKRYGHTRVFKDSETLPPGRNFLHALGATNLPTLIRRCDCMLALIGESWLETRDARGERRLDQPDDPVRTEIETAIDAEIAVIPVLVGRAGLPADERLPNSLKKLPFLQATYLRPGPEFGKDLDGLLERFENSFRLERSELLQTPPARRRHRAGVTAFLTAVLLPFVWVGAVAFAADARIVNNVALSPDGRYAVSAHGQGWGTATTLRLWDTRSGSQLASRTESNGPIVWILRWSPDGSRIATGQSDGNVRVWNPATLTPLRTLSGGQRMIESVEWSPSGDRIAAGAYGGTLHVWNTHTGTPVGDRFFNSGVSALSWSPDSNRLAVGGLMHNAMVVSANSKRLDTLRTFQVQQSVDLLAWSPHGEMLATTSLSGEDPPLVIHRLEEGGDTVRLSPGWQGLVDDLQWSPDGRRLATASWRGKRALVWRTDGTLERSLSYGSLSPFEPRVAWSPDGKWLASTGSAVRIWSLTDGTARELTVHDEDITPAGWTPDGRLLVTWSSSGIQIWDVGTRRSVAHCQMSLWDAVVASVR
ncbi:toll/interleukin-1 receptor domain-containing protein [Streptomyces sp. NPDC048479]|uniref:toll/interleukin-1 receptor domain-containing protein n=1 Tax=Streptomyces sp. NPDC048479 TaxID=3154725 RepID=UPI003413A358